MVQRYWIGAALVLAALGAPAHAQVTLEWKFKAGDRFYLEAVSTSKQSMKVTALGKELRQDFKVTTVFEVTVQKVNDDKSAVLEQKVKSFKVENIGNTTGALAAEDATKFGQLHLTGATFLLTVTPHGEVTRFEGYDELVKKLAGEDAAAREAVRAVLTDQYLKRSATEVFAVVPPGPVKGGDSWGGDKKQELPLGPLGSFALTRKFTYEGKAPLDDPPLKGSYDKITLTVAVQYNPPKPGSGAPFPFQLTKGDLKTDDGKGTVWFDADRGRLVGMETSLHLKGSLTEVVTGNTIDSEVDLEGTMKVRVVDQLPAPSPPVRQLP
jgi:hypothetical protein